MAIRQTISIRKTASSWLRSARLHLFLGSITRRCTTVASELDPVMPILLHRLTLGKVDGRLFSKDMFVTLGVIVLFVVEELI